MIARRSKVQQAYGYAVCLVCIIAGLITLVNVMNASMDFAHPEASPRFGFGPATQTFDEWKMMESRRFVVPGQPVQPLPPDSVLQRVYASERSEQLARAHWDAMRSFITNIVVLLVAIVLFVVHWRWLRAAGDDLASDTPLVA